MKFQDLESLLSESRLKTYYNLFPSDKSKAIEYYLLNTQISESFYPLLSNLEIILRNSIHTSFTTHFKSSDWFSKLSRPEIADQINIAKRKVLRSCNYITPDDLTALVQNHTNILEILNWINTDIVTWTKQVDRFNNLYEQAVHLRMQN